MLGCLGCGECTHVLQITLGESCDFQYQADDQRDDAGPHGARYVLQPLPLLAM